MTLTTCLHGGPPGVSKRLAIEPFILNKQKLIHLYTHSSTASKAGRAVLGKAMGDTRAHPASLKSGRKLVPQTFTDTRSEASGWLSWPPGPAPPIWG